MTFFSKQQWRALLGASAQYFVLLQDSKVLHLPFFVILVRYKF